MTRNPFITAPLATLYIVVLVYCIDNFFSKTGEETIMISMIMLSLFVLSAAVMGFLFVGQPLQMYLDGQKKEAVTLFMQTVGVFAVTTLILISVVFFFGGG